MAMLVLFGFCFGAIGRQAQALVDCPVTQNRARSVDVDQMDVNTPSDIMSNLQLISKSHKTSHIVINEIMPKPASGKEWVELYNSAESAVDISGWSLKEKAGSAGSIGTSTIPGKSFVIVEFSRKLNNGEDALSLYDANGDRVDYFEYSSSARGQSWMRIPDGGAWSKQLGEPTEGLPNPAHIVINEVMPKPASGKEWVELYNPYESAVDISGWSLTEKTGSVGNIGTRTIPAKSFIIAEFSRKLNDGGDALSLLNANGVRVDHYEYSSSTRGQSWVRIPDGGDWSKELGDPTKGLPNPAYIVINEVMPKPASGKEWVELYNPHESIVDISGWSLKEKAGSAGNIGNSTILAKSFIIVEFSRKLNDGDDALSLYNANGDRVDHFAYSSSVRGQSWMRRPDGGDWSKQLGEPTKRLPNPSPAQSTERGCNAACDDGLCFATWNIQNWGISKGKRPAVVTAIHTVLSRYDFVAIQELSQKPKAPFVCGDNTESVLCGGRPNRSYTAVASPRIGDEQYSLIFLNGSARVTGPGFTYPDPAKVHSRPPHAFDVTVTKTPGKSWKFAVALTHTSPKTATKEIHNFPEVISWMKTTFDTQDDAHHLLMVGDYNADGSYFRDEREWPDSQLGDAWAGYEMLTPNELDTTVAKNDHTYDRIIADKQLASNSDTAATFYLEDVDLSDVRVEGCQHRYVPRSVCSASLDGTSWADMPQEVKSTLAKELSDHHPVEVCLRG